MSDYKVSVGKRTYEVTIQKDILLVNGDQLKLEMESLNGNGLHILRHPNRNVEAYLQSNRKGTYEVQIDGNHLCVEVALGFHKQARDPRLPAGHLFSPMPGLIVDILVNEGDLVQKGNTVLVQEAMKMQMKIRTPCTGTITKINTAAGNQVDKGDLLVTLKPENKTNNQSETH